MAERASRQEKARRAARRQALKAEHCSRSKLARQASQAEPKRARQAHERARQRCTRDWPTAELTDLLAKRDLPKTGNKDELIERLVEADSR